jgi:hypothetical protein
LRSCRYIARQPQGAVDDVALRLYALRTILTADRPLMIAEAADDKLLDWVAAAAAARQPAHRRHIRHP